MDGSLFVSEIGLAYQNNAVSIIATATLPGVFDFAVKFGRRLTYSPDPRTE